KGGGYDILAAAHRQQRDVRGPFVSAVGRVFPDLRADAHPQPDARLDVHARRLFRHHVALGRAQRPIGFLAGSGRLRARGRATRRIDGTVAVAPSDRPAAGAGAGHAWCFLHGRRSVPNGLGWRSDFGGNSPRPQRLRPFRCGGVSALPARGDRHRRHLFACVVAHAGTNAAWRHDSRWRRRSADGPRRRHPGLATVYNRICTRRRPRPRCRVNRRPHPLRLPGNRPGHAAPGAGGRHSRRHRKPPRLVRRQHRHRLYLQFRPGAVAGACLFHPVSADGVGIGIAATGSVRGPDPVSNATLARSIAALIAIVALAALPYAIKEVYYVNIASQILLYAIFALGLNILVGYAGLVSLGHAGLFGIAAYVVAYLLVAGYGHVLAIAAALAATLLATAGFAAPALRSTGITFIMITLALGEIIWGLAYRWISLTNGDNGITVPARPAPFGIALGDARAFYVATLVVFLLTIAAAGIFVRSPFGAAL